MPDQKQIAARALNDLIATCHDSEEGYAKAAKGVHNDELRMRLTAISGRRDELAAELGRLVSGAGEAASQDAHYGGILHRGWVDLETRLRGKDDNEILRECAAGDEATLKHYDHALSLDLPPDMRAVVERQREGILRDLGELSAPAPRRKMHGV